MAQNYQLQKTGQEIDDLLQKIDGLDVATDESSGLMSAQDKSKLDGIESGAEENAIEGIVLGDQSLSPSGSKTVTIPMDDVPASGSNNPVKSSGVYAEIFDIKEVIPTTAAPGNKLTPKSQVDALIATALLNYYLKSETYSKSEVNALIAGIKQFTYQVVDSLPTASADTMYIVYFVPSSNPDTQNVKDEYITIESNGVYSFEQIGSTSIDISGKADKDTDAVEGNLAKFDSNGNPVDAGIAAEKVAQKGEIQTYSGNLVDTRSVGTAQEFTYRKSGGDGVNWMRRIKGKSLVWNQLADMSRLPATQTSGGVTLVKNADGGVTISAESAIESAVSFYLYTTATSGWSFPAHKYLLGQTGHNLVQFGVYKNNSSGVSPISSATPAIIDSLDATDTVSGYRFIINTGFVGSVTFTPQFIDLTLMFGAGNEPSTVEEFESMFPLPYYAYSAGTLISNDAVAMESVGFNQWDEEWELGVYSYTTGQKQPSSTTIRCVNLIKVLPNTSYYGYFGSLTSQGTTSAIAVYYDENGDYIGYEEYGVANRVFNTPSNCAYISFYCLGTIYNNDICINLSDASRNGQYEPYWKKSIQLGLNAFRVTDGTNIITVNGLKSAGSVYDEIDPVRKKYIKRIGEVDLGTLDYTYIEGGYFLFTAPGVKPGGAPIVCSKYATETARNVDKSIWYSSAYYGNYTSCITDSDYTDAASFKAAMDGVYLDFELATPVEYDLVDDIPNAIEVDENGTERAIFPEAVDPSAPFAADSNYSVSTANLVRKLNDAS